MVLTAKNSLVTKLVEKVLDDADLDLQRACDALCDADYLKTCFEIDDDDTQTIVEKAYERIQNIMLCK